MSHPVQIASKAMVLSAFTLASAACALPNSSDSADPPEAHQSALYVLPAEQLEVFQCVTEVPTVENADVRAPTVVVAPIQFKIGRWTAQGLGYKIGIVNTLEPSIAALSDAVWGVHRSTRGLPVIENGKRIRWSSEPQPVDGFWQKYSAFNLRPKDASSATSVIRIFDRLRTPNSPMPPLVGNVDFKASELDFGGRDTYFSPAPEYQQPDSFSLWKQVRFSTASGSIRFTGTFSNRIPEHQGSPARDVVGPLTPYVRTVAFTGSCKP
jgi:hypothetical protein